MNMNINLIDFTFIDIIILTYQRDFPTPDTSSAGCQEVICVGPRPSSPGRVLVAGPPVSELGFGFGLWGLGFGVWGLRFEVSGFGSVVWVLEVEV